MKAIVGSKEYQKMMRHLSHSHMIVEVDFANLTSDEKYFVGDLLWVTFCEPLHVTL